MRAVAFWTKSLALLADAFHYVSLIPKSIGTSVLHRQQTIRLTNTYKMNDLIGFIVALTAIIVSRLPLAR